MTLKTRKQNTRISNDQVKEMIASSPQRADALRADGFEVMINIKRAKLVQTRHERARLAERHGEDTEPVARLDRKMSVEHRFLVGSRAEHARIKTAPIERNEDTWQLHGYLRNQDGFPRNRYTVGLYSDNEGIEAPLITATTNSSGYFQLSWKPAAKKTTKTTTKKATKTETDTTIEAKTDGKNQPFDDKAWTSIRKTPLYLGARGGGKQALPVIDPRPLFPEQGIIAYRDFIVQNENDTGSQCHFATRLLGNSSSRELHNLDNEKKPCHLAAIRPDNRVYFQSEAQAEKIGYDFCAHCFGKGRSKK